MNQTRAERKNKRREAAEARARLRSERSDEEQLETLKTRGITKCREVEILKERIKKNEH